MEPMHREILTQNLPYMAENLKIDAMFVAYLVSKSSIEIAELMPIKEEKDQSEKVRKLDELLVEKSDGFRGLLIALDGTEQKDILRRLEEAEVQANANAATKAAAST